MSTPRTSRGLRWPCPLLFCLPVLLAFHSAHAGPSPNLRTGLWTTQQLPADPAALKAFQGTLDKSKDLAGISLHIPWNALETEAGKVDFSALDKTIAVLRGKGMKYQLCLRPGVSTPSFVYAEG